jgi:hypothetical protein
MRFAAGKTPSRDARIAFGRLVHGLVLIGGLPIPICSPTP